VALPVVLRVNRLAGRSSTSWAACWGPGVTKLSGRIERRREPEDSGYSAARRLLARPDRPTAVFAFNDITAIATLSAADDLDLDVPTDLSVVGYDNTYLSRIRHLSLTSVDNGNFAVGVQAAKFLLERLDNPRLPQRTYLVDTQLHIRRSTRAAQAP
jgi:DNA-binding LacI/PurR family transcriptional regulator